MFKEAKVVEFLNINETQINPKFYIKLGPLIKDAITQINKNSIATLTKQQPNGKLNELLLRTKEKKLIKNKLNTNNESFANKIKLNKNINIKLLELKVTWKKAIFFVTYRQLNTEIVDLTWDHHCCSLQQNASGG